VLSHTLAAAGLDSVSAASGGEALALLEGTIPSLVLLDLVMPDPDGYAVLRHIRARPQLAEVPVLVLTGLDSDDEIQRVFASGADDYVHKPFRPAELIARIRGQMRLRDYVDRLSRRERDSQTVLELTQALASTLDMHDILLSVVKRVAEVARRSPRIVLAENLRTSASWCDERRRALRDLTIDLGNPESARCSAGPVADHPRRQQPPVARSGSQNEPNIGFSSLALVPILHDHGPMGVIFLRSRGGASFADHEMALVRTVANATAIALRNARILQSLREETRESAFARVEAERRVQLFQRYADIFESAADGMVVIARSGRVLFANPRAREITGFSESELTQMTLDRMIGAGDSERARRLLRLRAGCHPRGVDVQIRTKDDEPVTLSVSFSSVLHEDDAILFTFRDVTLERKTAIELKQTKEFLERVIESSVDGIVSADLRGRVLLFNRAASRMFGYAPSEGVGRSASSACTAGHRAPGDAAHPGPRLNGRCRGLSRDMVTAQASSCGDAVGCDHMDSGKPVGSVGLFTDIREKLRMEARLNHAQEELRSREKQAIVAELAGAAAHELNQPLTSVIGYAELLRRSLEPSSQLAHAAQVIIGEAERMAEIVRKVGKITKYETKSYVGAAKILDLEKASEEEKETHG
jgi:PAS domain S-box-containing protein